MLFSSRLVSGLLFTTVVLADRHHVHRRSPNRLEVATPSASGGGSYEQDGAGAVLQAKDGSITSTTATFTIPHLVDQGKGDSGAFAWVGIDIGTCGNFTLLAGVELYKSSKNVEYKTLLGLLPDDTKQPHLSISAGDVIKLSVQKKSTSVHAAIKNTSTGKFVKYSGDQKLCGSSAGWIVQDVANGNGITVPLADYGKLVFDDIAITSSSGSYSPKDAGFFDMGDAGHVNATASADGSRIIFQYE